MLQLFGSLSRGEFYVAFYVFEDSVAAFNTAKQAAVIVGLVYGWMPLESKEGPLKFGAVGIRLKAQ